MKPQFIEKVEKTVIKYPHLYWRGGYHSNWCWCRNPELQYTKESNVLYISSLKKEGYYYWRYVEGEALTDGGA